MALTRPTIQNINTNLTTFTDSLTVTNFGNVANRDIGEVFDRSQGGGSNVAIVWNEENQSFRMGYTSSTGKEAGNITFTGNADLIVGNLKAGNLIISNVIYENTEYVSSTEVVAGNSTVNSLTVNNSATIGTTLGVTGNIYATNIIPTANATYNLGSPTQRFKSLYLSGNTVYMDGATISSNSTAIVFTNPNGGSLTIAGSDAIIANSTSQLALYVTGSAQGNITSVGTLTGLTLSGSLEGTAIYADTFGNNGAKFVGTVFTGGTFNGPLNGTLGSAGGNTAIVSTLTGTGNATVNALTVNTSATVGTTLGVVGNLTAGNINTAGTASVNQLVIASGIQNTPIGNATASSGNFTTLNATGAITGATTITTTGAATVNAITSNTSITGASLNVTGNATIGNLDVLGTVTYINSTTLDVQDPIIELNTGANGTPLSGSAPFDAGIKTHYWDGSTDRQSFFGRTNDTGNFEYYSNVISETGNVVTGTYGTIKTGNLLLTGQANVNGGMTIGGTLVANAFSVNTSISTSSLSVSGDIISAGGNIRANAGQISGATGIFSGNLTVLGNINGVTNVVATNSGAFYGNSVTGLGALYGGLPAGYTLLPNVVAQFTTNINNYSQLNIQNINSGTYASGDLVITADTGNDTGKYIDLGINSSNFNNPAYTAYGPLDSYLLADGGNLLLNVEDSTKTLKFIVGGYLTANVQGDWNTARLAVNTATASTNYTNGAIVTLGGLGVAGAINAGGAITSTGNATVAALTVNGSATVGTTLGVSGNVIAGNVSAGTVNATYFIGNGSQLTGLPAQYANANVAAYLPTYSGTIGGQLLTNAQPNITSVGTLTTLAVSGTISSSGNVTSGNLTVNGSATIGTTLGVTGNVVVGNLTTGSGTGGIITGANIISANYFIGNGSGLTSITGANVTGTVANATYATNAGSANFATTATGATYVTGLTSANVTTALGYVPLNSNNSAISSGTAQYVTGNAQANITSVGTLTSLTSSGDITSTGGYLIGNGSKLTNITAANISGTVANATYATSAGSSNFATTAGTATYVTNATQANITSLGNLTALTVTGDTVMYGNLQVLGNTTYINSNVITTNDLNITVGNNQSTGSALNGAGIDVGSNSLVTWRYDNSTTSWQSNVGITPTANASLNLGGTSNYWNNVYAVQYNGSGAGLTNIPGAQVTGTVANATYATTAGSAGSATTAGTAQYVTQAAQANITSVGALTSLTVTGATQVNTLTVNTNANIGTDLSVIGKLYVGTSANTSTFTNPVAVFTGAGASYDQLALVNTTGTGSADYTAYANNGTDVQGWMDMGMTGNLFNDGNYTITGKNDGYIFANGVTGNSSLGGNLVIATGSGGSTNDIVFATGGFLAANEKMRFSNSTSVFRVSGTITTTGITSSGNATVSALTVNGSATIGTTLGVVGNVYTGNLITTNGVFWANGTAYSSGGGSGTPGGANTYVQFNDAGSFGGNTNFTYNKTTSQLLLRNNNVITNYTGNTAPSNPKQGDEWYYRPTDTIYKYINDGTSNVWISLSTLVYNANTGAVANTLALRDSGGNLTATNFLGIASSAKYADLAEIYTSDLAYAPGTVVIFGGAKEVTVTSMSHDTRVAGVISTNPAYLMNSDAIGLPVALTGRVPCLVKGPVRKGDILVTSNEAGIAEVLQSDLYKPGCIIGKSLQDIIDNETTMIEVVVGRF